MILNFFKAVQVVNGIVQTHNEANLSKNWPLLPNGNYRVRHFIHDDIDSNIITIVFQIENKHANGNFEQ